MHVYSIQFNCDVVVKKSNQTINQIKKQFIQNKYTQSIYNLFVKCM